MAPSERVLLAGSRSERAWAYVPSQLDRRRTRPAPPGRPQARSKSSTALRPTGSSVRDRAGLKGSRRRVSGGRMDSSDAHLPAALPNSRGQAGTMGEFFGQRVLHLAPLDCLMIRQTIPTWLGVSALVLALAGGAALKFSVKDRRQVREPDLRSTVAPFLLRHGYRVTPAATDQTSSKNVAAQAGFSCRLQVIELQARGYNQNAVRQTAGPTDEFFVVFQGTVHEIQPVWQTKVHYYWNRLRQELGMAGLPRPVLAVVASATCSARDLPWYDLAQAALLNKMAAPSKSPSQVTT